MNNRAFLEDTAKELAASICSVDDGDVETLADMILGAKRVFIVGAGRTLLMIRALAMSLMQIGLQSAVVGDVTTPAITKSDLLIAASYSGKTRSTDLFISQAKTIGANIALLTAHPDSDMGKKADLVIHISSASDDISGKTSPQFEGNGFEHALVPLGDAVIMNLCRKTDATEQTMLARHANLE